MDHPIITAILQESLLLFLIIGSLFALLLGLLFVIAPEKANRFSQQNNRWLSLRRSTRPLDISHSVDASFYHHHRLVGLFIILSSAYILYRLGFDYYHQEAITALTAAGETGLTTSWLLESLLWFIIPTAVLFLFIGAAIAIKPSSLKGLEGLSNRWLSTRRAMQPIEKSYISIDKWVERHPRLFGSILCIAAVYNLTMLFLFLINK